MVDVARHAGVSVKTVSRVVNREPNVAEPLMERVLASVAELGFRRNHLARTLRSGRSTATIGLVIEEFANPFYATIAGVAAEVAAGHDTLLITASSEEDAAREEELVRDLCSRRVDGLLIVPAGYDHEFLRDEMRLGLPVVFLDRPGGGLPADTVLLDNRGGARAGVARLLAAGHRRIGVLLDSTGVYTMGERVAGARDAVAAAGLPPATAVIHEGVRDPDSAASAAGALLDGADPPTAFFALNNRIAVGVVAELCRRDDPAELLGFDDFEVSGLMPRPLTVIAYDTRALARTAAELLFARVGGAHPAPRTVTLPTALVSRGLPRPPPA